MLGLFAFFYACLHVLAYLALDQGFAWADIAKRPYITVGFAAFLLLVPLAATSTDGMIRRLGGQRWKRLHRLVYPIAIVDASPMPAHLKLGFDQLRSSYEFFVFS